jgi:hypothetical protein
MGQLLGSQRRLLLRFLVRNLTSVPAIRTALPVAIVFSIAGASRMNGSQRGPAKTRVPLPASPFTATVTVAPSGSVHVHSCAWPSSAVEKTQSMTRSSSLTGLNGAGPSAPLRLSSRSLNRWISASEKRAGP